MKTVFKVHRAGNNSLEKTDLESKHSGKRACEQLTKSPTKESLYLQARKEYEQNSLFYTAGCSAEVPASGRVLVQQ